VTPPTDQIAIAAFGLGLALVGSQVFRVAWPTTFKEFRCEWHIKLPRMTLGALLFITGGVIGGTELQRC